MGSAIKLLIFLVLAAVALLAGSALYAGYFNNDPFITVEPSGHPDPAKAEIAAVFLSGDLGFNFQTGGNVMERLASDGIPVVGVNSATFFRARRTPAETSAMLADAATRALSIGNKQRLILIGKSFGADMLQVGLAGLPRRLRLKVKSIVLIAPTKTIYFQISPVEMLDRTTPDLAGIATGRLLTWAPTLCIYGAKDSGSLCPQLKQDNVVQIRLPGGHLMNKDGTAIYRALGPAL